MENLEMKAITAARVANEESKARKHSFRDMMRIICERCPSRENEGTIARRLCHKK